MDPFGNNLVVWGGLGGHYGVIMDSWGGLGRPSLGRLGVVLEAPEAIRGRLSASNEAERSIPSCMSLADRF